MGGTPGGDGGAGPMSTGGYCADKPITLLPMVVSDSFFPTGYLVDHVDDMDLHQIMEPCPSRPASAVGKCFTFEWTPTTSTWAGMLFQYPANNWDTKPGLCVQAGAKVVRFQVRGAAGGEKVRLSAVKVYSDIMALSTSWQEVQLSLVGVDYNAVNPMGGVDGGVQLVFTDAALGKQRAYIDDVRWE
jgi:hypothetical protein